MQPSVRPLRAGAVGALALAILLVTGCGQGAVVRASSSVPAEVSTVDAPTSTRPSAPAADALAAPPAPAPQAAALSPLAALVRPAGSALFDPAAATVGAPPAPVAVTIEALGVRDAPVLAVGVRDDGELEVPGASDIGWYRHGPRPGDGGSAVLAAHVAFDGVDGVFRHLDRLGPGGLVQVRLADGTERTFRVTAQQRYAKDALPPDVFATDGSPRLALITCGGPFDRSTQSYRDNVVAYAEPV